MRICLKLTLSGKTKTLSIRSIFTQVYTIPIDEDK